LAAIILAPRRHALFILAALAVLMSSIDNTIVAVALPEIKRTLDAPLSWTSWTLTSYQLVQVVMLPLAGKLSDSLGRTRVFLFSLAIFTLASLLCGLAPNIALLIVFRALQAIGGGGLLPSAVGIVADRYPVRRAQAVGIIGSAMPLGTIVGPNLGGFLLQVGSWRALFWVNVPIGIAVIGAVALMSSRVSSPRQSARTRIDLLGAALYGAAIVTLIYAMTLVANDPSQAGLPLVWALIVLSLGLGGAFVWHVRRAADPVMDYRLLATNPFLAANIYNFFYGAATLGVFSFVPYYAVTHFGLSSFQSGAVLTPRALIVLCTSILGSVYILRFGYRRPMLFGLALNCFTFLLLAQGWTGLRLGAIEIDGYWLLAAILAVAGLGNGVSNPASNNAALELAPRQAAAITGIRGTFRLTGGTLSIAAIVLTLSFFPDQNQGFSVVFFVSTGILLVISPLVFMIPDGRVQHHPSDATRPSEVEQRDSLASHSTGVR
jgi:EmrB/QacA subfamily drug resistance transporter